MIGPKGALLPGSRSRTRWVPREETWLARLSHQLEENAAEADYIRCNPLSDLAQRRMNDYARRVTGGYWPW